VNNEVGMSVVEDTRKLVQDFLAPELKEISVRLDSIEILNLERFKESGRRFDAQEALNAERFKDIGRRFEAQEALNVERFKNIDRRFEEMDRRFIEIDRRFDRAEERANERLDLILTKLAVVSDVTELRFRVTAMESRDKAS